jgi:hypothetical protein
VIIAVFIACSVALGNPALPEPLQSDDFCNHLKIAGTGAIDIGYSVVDKKMALEYYNVMQGDGDIEMDSTNAVSQAARKIRAPINGSTTPLNLYDTIKLTYSGKIPLVGMKSIKSNAFYGGMGAEVTESFSVTEMEKIQTTYFASTNPAIFLKDPGKLLNLMKSPVHAVGMDSKTSFNGTWITDAKWHKIFYKDVKVHEAFSGKFDVEKSLQFHENPVPEQRNNACDDLDC